MSGGFTWHDWLVVGGLLVLTTVVGKLKAGKQQSVRDFFLGGRRLPWYVVSASIVATEISAVTLISFPSVVFRPGGDLTYLQIGLFGSLIARLVVGFVLVPAYYRREIYSPYDYVGNVLGRGAKVVTTALFALGGILGQAARVYLTGVVLEVLLHDELAALGELVGLSPLAAAIACIGVVAVVWTLLGGIAAVVWTDGILFLLFLVAIGVALATLSSEIDGGLGEALRVADEAHKLRWIDTSLDPTKAYTLFAALVLSAFGQIGPYGTDQLMAQRMFCCRGPKEARKAIIGSYVAMVLTVLVSLLGIGLYAYYRQHPLEGDALALFTAKNDRIFPIFVVEVVPAGLRGLILAGAFAAAISSLDSILAALAQTTVSLIPGATGATGATDATQERRTVRLSRLLVVVWGVVLCVVAVAMERVEENYDSILDLALAMAGFTGGALLAAFFLAFLPLRVDGSGLVWSAPLSVLAVLGVAWHEPQAAPTIAGLGAGLLGVFLVQRVLAPGAFIARELERAILLAAAAWGAATFAQYGLFESEAGVLAPLAWPWYVPIGCAVAFVFGIVLADGERTAEADAPS